MSEVQLTWVKGGQFVGVDSTKHSVVLSTGSDGTGAKPSDMLMIALAGCSAVDVVSILQKKRQALTGLEVSVEGQQDPEPPWAFNAIHLKYVLRGKGLSEKAIQQAIDLSEEKYCSVSATLRCVAKITHSFEIIEDTP
ncbi:MAG: OsmC family protein [Thermoflexales bacterium]|nr:OsmC family protein [Thermoflexales bacterium]